MDFRSANDRAQAERQRFFEVAMQRGRERRESMSAGQRSFRFALSLLLGALGIAVYYLGASWMFPIYVVASLVLVAYLAFR